RRRGRRGGRDRHPAAQGDSQGNGQMEDRPGEQNAAQADSHEGSNPPSTPTPSHPASPQQAFSSEADRFGRVADEIDTTPSMERVSNPGAPSAPVWSLKDDIPDTTPRDEPARPDAGKTEAPKPAKKGWWQRTFSGS
ncbi:MAG TPA: hypothetical protein VG501_11195, partial [Rhizomicrobium sp.]|nr:hypothetical protein [Rhizomicrobium sp.]